ncbi:ATP-binding cassette domain-containing protein [Pseudemcibacter aquimaris]|uniref:ABC transporter ATP-binding protein n=1 Tax=Pseudemcibacter aquimaris TaxID=2857064 RepID=UPI002011D60B|nr:ATP-binding cassette domain-containing protein [Pseudemcibacter aquimaris]MCC3862306.1 ATP-binding cassette domain-containing protein [Pseudemcibacter aquimaris]WDU59054.1 ATP-binding cassette domain-containing protein [Pseudemcibacter aquimaris]
MLEIKKISKSYGEVKAVQSLSFTAHEGQITTLLGANGCGKTTTLRAIAGLIPLDQGSIILNGINVHEHTIEARQHLGIFPDIFGLYPRLTTIEHLEYFGKLHGLKGHILDKAVKNTVEILNMSDIADRRTEGFSQGQRMKVALGRSFIHSPKVLVLDEPTRGLDIFNVRLLRDHLRKLTKEGVCILMSCHVMAEVEDLSDKVVCMADGKKKATGSPAELIERAGTDNLEDAFVQYVS